MATNIDITVTENNDETLDIDITPEDTSQDLTTITSLEFYLKEDNCFSDAEAELVLTSADPNEINIVSQTSSLIEAQVFIPASALAQPYNRFWRIDGLTAGGDRQTAIFGDVSVNNV